MSAHFIYLVAQVFADLKIFTFMWLLFMIAFGNTFYIINKNTPMTDDDHLVGNYSHIPFFDAIIEMYMFTLGEYDLDAIKGNISGFA